MLLGLLGGPALYSCTALYLLSIAVQLGQLHLEKIHVGIHEFNVRRFVILY